MNPALLSRVERVEPRLVRLGAAALLVAALLAAWFWLIRPPLGEYRALNAARERSVRDIAGLEASVDRREIDTLLERIGTLEQVLQAGRDGASANEMMADIIGTLDRLAGEHGVVLTGVKPGQAGEVLSFEEQPFDVEATGRYFDLIAWLRAAERDLRPMLIKQFRFRAVDDRGGGLAVSVRVVSYRVRETPS